jgi:predicted small secreted protein
MILFLHRHARAASLAVLLAGLALAGCNTAHGFGQDVKHAGQHIEHSTN